MRAALLGCALLMVAGAANAQGWGPPPPSPDYGGNHGWGAPPPPPPPDHDWDRRWGHPPPPPRHAWGQEPGQEPGHGWRHGWDGPPPPPRDRWGGPPQRHCVWADGFNERRRICRDW